MKPKPTQKRVAEKAECEESFLGIVGGSPQLSRRWLENRVQPLLRRGFLLAQAACFGGAVVVAMRRTDGSRKRKPVGNHSRAELAQLIARKKPVSKN
ncbi:MULTISPECIES: hypothetical protein [unclassified Roseateles]|uniref:hypothetical protein n=1 Tax=unclassified Roseateles TaxID=2626991 RepID=UPI0012E351C6|nr:MULTISPECIES: hypothetical protein [unclassified Roseateles]